MWNGHWTSRSSFVFSENKFKIFRLDLQINRSKDAKGSSTEVA